jgi:hypothetical protein
MYSQVSWAHYKAALTLDTIGDTISMRRQRNDDTISHTVFHDRGLKH